MTDPISVGYIFFCYHEQFFSKYCGTSNYLNKHKMVKLNKVVINRRGKILALIFCLTSRQSDHLSLYMLLIIRI